ncbi:hypothetical protein PAECIP111893_02415 [Paenibacillus plantiphilus]|uniref:Uncharacterized protein n=1 Tax=Paenibacillus plantiphilus TaxID=2905650 RepID=A0ABM9C875_9BACL|nr:hypothetical protein [Paenibacillus plantiphilus]CAH1205776.1 hypothetical protein PAECIP111893_02415 [Paenibacillus plantiphilus]
MNKTQIDEMEHAIRNQNRFYTDADNKNWNDLVEKGYATKRPGWDDRSAYFCPTSEGIAALRDLVAE